MRKLLEAKVCFKKFLKMIKTGAVLLVRCSGVSLKWTREELQQLAQRTGKWIMMHKALHQRDHIHRIYVPRKEEERGYASIKKSVDTSIRLIEDYIKKRQEALITAAKNNSDTVRKNRRTITRKQKWQEKQLHGYFNRKIGEISHEKTWAWIRNGNFKCETKSLLVAAENNAKRTNYIKAKIDNIQQKCKCTFCNDRDQTINYISKNRKLAQKKVRQDTTAWETWSKGIVQEFLNLIILWQYTTSRLPFSQSPHLCPGVSLISIRTYKTQHTQRRGWKKIEQTNTDLG